MRGVGGPLLSIGDLLSDLADSPPGDSLQPSSISADSPQSSQPIDLSQLFQENYKSLNEALAGSDPSWTALTLKLCSSVETANKLVESTNLNVRLLSEKVEKLEEVVKRGDAAVTMARGVISSFNRKKGRQVEIQNSNTKSA